MSNFFSKKSWKKWWKQQKQIIIYRTSFMALWLIALVGTAFALSLCSGSTKAMSILFAGGVALPLVLMVFVGFFIVMVNTGWKNLMLLMFFHMLFVYFGFNGVKCILKNPPS